MSRGIRWALASLLVALALPAGAQNAPAAAPADRTVQGDAVCTRCHDESESKPILAMYKTRHGVKADERTPGCQSCHGASEAHVKNATGSSTRPLPDVTFGKRAKGGVDKQVAACLTCHEGGKRSLWHGSQHQGRDVACAQCHTVHAAEDRVLVKAAQPEVCFSCHKSERAQVHRFSTHPIAAGKLACSDCHNPHGSTGPKLLVRNSVNETCYTCHAEKRGPFLWEHAPVADDCTNCHTPHGSTNPTLLKTRVPWLCQDCHSGDHGAQVNSGANLIGGNVTTVNGANPLANAAPRAQLLARACLNCHVLVHGSNHPAGSKFQR
ncbi:MAG: DmsE family decaheme c-type cytochrome [Proteobacteria bacterium]|nr:DmsE family decaheme c-type cytochrome [Pseudomonadota bacterium]